MSEFHPNDSPNKEADIDPTNPKDRLGVKKAPLRLVPPALTIVTAPAMAQGAAKYGPYNWREKPVKLTVYLEAMLRHILALLDGEDVDPDSGFLHLSHIGANVAIIADAMFLAGLIDDRPLKGPAAEMLWKQDQTHQNAAVETPKHAKWEGYMKS